MTQAQSTAAAPLMPEQTVWSEHVSWIDRVPRWVSMVALMVGFLAVWQLVYLIELVSPIILPSPAETIEDLFVVGRNLLTGDYMLKALWVTTQEVLLGFIIAVVFGFALGVLVGETSFGERAVMPYLVAVNTMPKVAFAPLFVSWLGFGIASKVALAAFIAFFPVIVGTAAGLHAADQNARMLFKTMGASRWQTLVQLKLPIGMPHFFSGLEERCGSDRRRRGGGRVSRRRQGLRRVDPCGGRAARHAARVLADHLSEPARAGDVLDCGLGPAPVRLLAQGNRHRGDSCAISGRGGVLAVDRVPAPGHFASTRNFAQVAS